jgi:hypothetical protein
MELFKKSVVNKRIRLYSADPGGRESKAWVYERLLFGMAGSNPAGGIDVCLL